MMNPVNFNQIIDGDRGTSNYRLRHEPIETTITIQYGAETPDNGAWENEGGAGAPPPIVESLAERNAQYMKVRGAKKQTAARAYRPKESIMLIKPRVIQPAVQVIAQLTEQTEEEITIEILEMRVKQVMGLIQTQGTK